MIIARATEDGREFLLIGFSCENIRRMIEGQPIKMARETHGAGVPEGWTLAFMFGETEMEMKAQLESAGLVDSKTDTYMDPRLKK
jgi:hypothetical protein